jgi:hypothetical protein
MVEALTRDTDDLMIMFVSKRFHHRPQMSLMIGATGWEVGSSTVHRAWRFSVTDCVSQGLPARRSAPQCIRGLLGRPGRAAFRASS